MPCLAPRTGTFIGPGLRRPEYIVRPEVWKTPRVAARHWITRRVNPFHPRSSFARLPPGAPIPRLRRAWALLGYILIVLTIVVSLRPLPVDLATGGLDKLAHFLTYATLTLWFLQLAAAGRFGRIAMRFLVLGILIELAQGQTEYRYFSLADIAANGVGILAALVAGRAGMSSFLTWLEAVVARKTLAPATPAVDAGTAAGVQEKD